MSSVIVKGMKIPSECRMCPLCRYFYSTGVTRCMLMQTPLAEDYKTISFEGRHEDCQLAELPEKHGRLIDADALGDKMSGKWTVYDYQALGAMPTIVEAEGEE